MTVFKYHLCNIYKYIRSRDPRSNRSIRIRLLRVCSTHSLGDVHDQGRTQLAQVLCVTTESTDKWFLWCTVHLCTVLDIYIWNGTCILAYYKFLGVVMTSGNILTKRQNSNKLPWVFV